jgi:hypothetical protein
MCGSVCTAAGVDVSSPSLPAAEPGGDSPTIGRRGGRQMVRIDTNIGRANLNRVIASLLAQPNSHVTLVPLAVPRVHVRFFFSVCEVTAQNDVWQAKENIRKIISIGHLGFLSLSE